MTRTDYLLLAAHGIFWTVLIGLSLTGFSVPGLNRAVRPEVLWAVFLLPPLEISSLCRARKMLASRVRRYLLALVMMGTLFWIFALGYIWVLH